MKGPDYCNNSPRRTACKMTCDDFSEYMWMADELEDFDRKVNPLQHDEGVQNRYELFYALDPC